MQVNDIYRVALSYISEKPKVDDLQSFIVDWMNVLLAEALPYENNVRRHKGLPELEASARVAELTDEMPYQDEICNPALIYGLTAFVAQDDDNEYRMQEYRNMYISALYDTQKYERVDMLSPLCNEVVADG